MREIKFRGKRADNGEWVYGYPIIVSYKAWIKDINDTTTNPRRLAQDFADFRCVEVEKETVGQFTGLKDKNGVEIYEGDVTQDVDTGKTFEITYQGHMFMRYERKPMYMFYTLDGDCLEVIGNIHDLAGDE